MGFRGCFSSELLCDVNKRLQDIGAGRSGKPSYKKIRRKM